MSGGGDPPAAPPPPQLWDLEAEVTAAGRGNGGDGCRFVRLRNGPFPALPAAPGATATDATHVVVRLRGGGDELWTVTRTHREIDGCFRALHGLAQAMGKTLPPDQGSYGLRRVAAAFGAGKGAEGRRQHYTTVFNAVLADRSPPRLSGCEQFRQLLGLCRRPGDDDGAPGAYLEALSTTRADAELLGDALHAQLSEAGLLLDGQGGGAGLTARPCADPAARKGKLVHFVRRAEAWHDRAVLCRRAGVDTAGLLSLFAVADRDAPVEHTSPPAQIAAALRDPPLTPDGAAECGVLRRAASRRGVAPSLVVCAPQRATHPQHTRATHPQHTVCAPQRATHPAHR
eukprot:gene22867-21638_t